MSTNTKLVKIKGMTCSNCEKKIARKLRSTDGIKAVEVSLAENQARIEYNTNTISMSEIVKIIEETTDFASEDASQESSQELSQDSLLCINTEEGVFLFNLAMKAFIMIQGFSIKSDLMTRQKFNNA